MPKPACLLLLPAAVLAATATPAYAYLDPGTGSIILQALLGGAAGVAIAGKLYWRRFLVLIGVRRDEPPAEQGKPQVDP